MNKWFIIFICGNIDNWAFLGRGVYGEVWKTEIAHINGEKQPVVLKTFTWPPFLSIKDVKLRFDDLINEIRICQELTMSGSSNIVRYEGFYAPEVHSCKHKQKKIKLKDMLDLTKLFHV